MQPANAFSVVEGRHSSPDILCYYDDKMNKEWFQLGATILLPLMALVAGYFAGQRGRSIAIATTVEKDWLNCVAEDLAEFIELQIDIVWKRWRIKVKASTDPETSSLSYEKESFRSLQDASWQQTFRSDLLKSKLLLMLDDRDVLQEQLIAAIDEYSKHAPEMTNRVKDLDKDASEQVANDFDRLLREKKPFILNAGRRVLAAKRTAIRKSI